MSATVAIAIGGICAGVYVFGRIVPEAVISVRDRKRREREAGLRAQRDRELQAARERNAAEREAAQEARAAARPEAGGRASAPTHPHLPALVSALKALGMTATEAKERAAQAVAQEPDAAFKALLGAACGTVSQSD